MKTHVVALERHNLSELEVIQRLADTIGIDAFEADVSCLAGLHAIDPEEPIQAIRAQSYPSIIGLSEPAFQVMQRVSDTLVERQPALLSRRSYRCRDSQQTALPWALWLALVRHARSEFDPAGLDADFLMTRIRAGLSTQEAVHAPIASKRSVRQAGRSGS